MSRIIKMEGIKALASHYLNRQSFFLQEVERLKKEHDVLTYKEYLKIDSINFTETSGLRDFCEKYEVSGKIIDIGSGFGGGCRIMHCEFGLNPVGFEYLQGNVDIANQISRDLGLPEMYQQGDASEPLPFQEVDVITMFEILDACPRELQSTILDNVYAALKPGGILFLEDFGLETQETTFPEQKQAALDENPHFKQCLYFADIISQLETLGFEVVEKTDVSQSYCEGSWRRSNDYYLPWYEESHETMDEKSRNFTYIWSQSQQKLWSDLTHMTEEQIRERYPLTVKYVDPAVHVFGVPHEDLKAYRFICRKRP